MTPSSLPLCASIGPRTTSPTAHTFGTLVRQCSSTWMKPRSSSLTPGALRQQPLGEGPAPDRDHQLVHLQRMLALRIGIDHVHGGARHGGARHLGARA